MNIDFSPPGIHGLACKKICIDMSTVGKGESYLDVSLMEEAMTSGGLSFPGTGCPELDVDINYLLWNY